MEGNRAAIKNSFAFIAGAETGTSAKLLLIKHSGGDVKGWPMIHEIKSMYDNGDGVSIRGIAKALSISRNTVRKYLQMPEREISDHLDDTGRFKRLDPYRAYIISLLERFGKLSAVKIKRKCTMRGVEEGITARTYRRYVNQLKAEVLVKRVRNYEPVIDMLPGIQCQVDMGELTRVIVGGVPQKIYFCVFVLSYSRYMYVSVSPKPINTERFIKMHSEAFSFFGGMPEECVYDQTKLVVIKERFREVWLNDAFSQYATTAGFYARICEGYDPESKGKVEAGVKYVKNDFFYGDEFRGMTDIKERLNDWLFAVANVRIHGTHRMQPAALYESKERQHMKPCLEPAYLASESEYETRKADKTSLISYKSNKYSVPCAYQEHLMDVREDAGKLIVMDHHSKETIATHSLSYETGQIVKNRNHYRDHEKTVKDRENEVARFLGENLSSRICHLLKQSNPKIYKDQITGLITVIKKYSGKVDMDSLFSVLAERSHLTATKIEEHMDACCRAIERNEREHERDMGTLSAREQRQDRGRERGYRLANYRLLSSGSCKRSQCDEHVNL